MLTGEQKVVARDGIYSWWRCCDDSELTSKDSEHRTSAGDRAAAGCEDWLHGERGKKKRHKRKKKKSWLVWLSGQSASLWTERSPVRFPVRWARPQLGTCETQPIDVSLAHRCFSPSLSPSFPLSLKVNK